MNNHLFTDFARPVDLAGEMIGWRLRNQDQNDPRKAFQVPVTYTIQSDKREYGMVGFSDVWKIEKGAVTGYEAFRMDDGSVAGMILFKAWYACAGGMGWDSLCFSNKQMRRVVDQWIQARKILVGICPECRRVAEIHTETTNPRWFIFSEGKTCRRADHEEWRDIYAGHKNQKDLILT